MLQKILIEKVWTWYAIHFTHQPNGNEPKARKKNFCRKKKKKKKKKIQIQIFSCQMSLDLIQPVNRLASTTVWLNLVSCSECVLVCH